MHALHLQYYNLACACEVVRSTRIRDIQQSGGGRDKDHIAHRSERKAVVRSDLENHRRTYVVVVGRRFATEY